MTSGGAVGGHTPGASSWREVGLAALLYTALTCALAYPLSAHLTDRVPSAAPDTELFLWTLAWDAHALAHPMGPLFDANIYHPARHTLAYSENLIGDAIFVAPVIWLTGSPVLAMNLLVLGSAVLCGVGTMLLARRVGVGAGGALLAGLIFALSPPRFLRLDQVHLATIQWIPFGLASLHAFLDGGRRRDAWLVAAFFTLQALSSGHGAVFFALAMLVIFGCDALRGRVGAFGEWLRALGIPGALLLAPTLLMVEQYLAVQKETGLKRGLEVWSVPWASFVASPAHVPAFVFSLVPGWRLADLDGPTLFPGILPIALAVYALWRKTHARMLPYVVLTLVSLWLSVGRPIGIWPLVYWLPGLTFIRAPSRFMLLAILGIAVLAGWGFERLVARRSAPQRWALTVLVGAMLVGEFTAAPLAIDPYRLEIPAIDRWLGEQPGPFTIAELPVGHPGDRSEWERRETMFMLHSTAHWQKTVHGYSGWRPYLHGVLYEQLATFPDEQSLRSLVGFGVTHIVVHTDLYRAGEWPVVEAGIAGAGELLRLEHVEGTGRVYSVHRPQ